MARLLLIPRSCLYHARNHYTLPVLVICLIWLARLTWFRPIVVDPYQSKRDLVKEFKRGLALELNKIHEQMIAKYIQKRPPSLELLFHMEEIVHRLDDRIKLSQSNDTGEVPSTVVCSEEYHGAMAGYPFFHKGWVITNCSYAKPIRSVITVLINAVSYPKKDQQQVVKVLNGIQNTYPSLQVYLATNNKEIVTYATEQHRNVEVLNTDATSIGKVWNQLVDKVSTPYVLIARDVVHFNWLSLLERQIRVVSQIPKVGIAGGSYRNLTGHWRIGCSQSSMRNYVLEYQDGYFFSRNSCMFCDYLRGPFVADKNVLTAVRFDEALPNQVVFEDFFLRVVQEGILAMACPDAMYFTTDYTTQVQLHDKSVWTPLAKKWQLNRVLTAEGVVHSFSCKDIGSQCNTAKITTSYLLPVCCLELYANALKDLKEFCDQHNIVYELDSGLVLGSVKFSGLLPWDRDGDLILLAHNMSIFGEKGTVELFKTKGYNLHGFEPPKFDKNGKVLNGGFVRLDKSDFSFEFWGMPELSNPSLDFLPPELREPRYFTKTEIMGTWIHTAYSPGFYARSRYGREILKHAGGWSRTGLNNSYGLYKSGTFQFTACHNPGHHACVENFPADGNIPLRVPRSALETPSQR